MAGTTASRAIGLVALAQFLGTSLWFSANSAAEDLARDWQASVADIGTLTSAVQLGFITGTLALALSGVADRFRASRIFVVSALMGALLNACFAFAADGIWSGAVTRFLVGVCLAGIYPLGMKLIVSWAPERAGASLALLVGMLSLGTALPHAVRAVGVSWDWRAVVLVSSGLAVLAAALVYWLGDGPHLPSTRPGKAGGVLRAFASPQYRASAFGYFGHMWELYAFWTLVPTLLAYTTLPKMGGPSGLAILSFATIGVGALGCVIGGAWSKRVGSANVAAIALAASGVCCLVFGIAGTLLPPPALLALLLVWGAAVVADSPHFSALSVQYCPRELVGSALAIQNSIGFAITMVSIGMTTHVVERWGFEVALLLMCGPLFGLAGFYPLWGRKHQVGAGH